MKKRVIVFSIILLVSGLAAFIYWRKRKKTLAGTRGAYTKMSYKQFYKLIELLESSIEMFDMNDWEYYSQITGISLENLMSWYASYGRSNFSTSEKNKKIINLLKKHYCKVKDRTWEHIAAVVEKDSFNPKTL